MRPSLAQILSFVGGYVDTLGFLALQGLFTAHVTGNFVTFAAAMVHGATGAWAKLLVLPVFCVAVLLTRLASRRLDETGRPALRVLLAAQCTFLFLGAVLAVALGPFADADRPAALLTGMVLVAAMAVQNAAHRAHLPEAPPSTLMTGTTTQIMIDLADLLRGVPAEHASRLRIARMSAAVAAFALGCGLAALLYYLVGIAALVLAPALILIAATDPASAKAT
ncbi:YoaK family protein [Methylobacterium tarhaniae]|uniref:YoaK family protein n=1 Tax=Methylobacterium tarhaniae TaxID=1187852 RepID=UPI003D08E807